MLVASWNVYNIDHALSQKNWSPFLGVCLIFLRMWLIIIIVDLLLITILYILWFLKQFRTQWQIMLTIVGFLLAHSIKKFYAQHCHGNFVISNVKLKLNTFAAKLSCNICHAWYHTCSKNLIFVDIIYPLVVVLQSKSATC